MVDRDTRRADGTRYAWGRRAVLRRFGPQRHATQTRRTPDQLLRCRAADPSVHQINNADTLVMDAPRP